jgi:hypothetical protein
VLEVHYDTVNPARREMVRLGLHLRDTKNGELSADSLAALNLLEKWFQAGASSDLKAEGAEVATRISTFFRFIATPVTLKYGGGESGLARFLKDAAARIAANPRATFNEDECRFIDDVLGAAWRDQVEANGNRSIPRINLGWFDSLDGFGSLDPSHDLAAPDITCLDGQTLKSQAAQSYTQWVPLGDGDAAMTICPIGHSDRPESRWRTSTKALWGQAGLHPAPLSRKGVEKIAVERAVVGPAGGRLSTTR